MFRLIKSNETIYGMALSRKDLAAIIEDNTREIICHLAKLYYFQEDKDDLNHWRGEIYAFLHNVKRLKGSNKFPDANFIFKNTFIVNESSVEICMEDTYVDYCENHVPTRDYDLNEFTNIVKEYFTWLSNILSNRGQVSKDSISKKLIQLGL